MPLPVIHYYKQGSILVWVLHENASIYRIPGIFYIIRHNPHVAQVQAASCEVLDDLAEMGVLPIQTREKWFYIRALGAIPEVVRAIQNNPTCLDTQHFALYALSEITQDAWNAKTILAQWHTHQLGLTFIQSTNDRYRNLADNDAATNITYNGSWARNLLRILASQPSTPGTTNT